MKKIFFLLSMFGVFFLSVYPVFASEDTMKIKVSEYIIGANCTCTKTSASGICPSTVAVSERAYECEVPSGLTGFESVLANIIRWFMNIAMLLCVLAVVGLGIMWAMAGGDDATKKTNVKKFAINIIIGMIILIFFRYILQFLAPWIYK